LIQESCKLAVEICDDLLNYEKFEDEDMPLVMKTLPATLLFHEIVQPFNVQVRLALPCLALPCLALPCLALPCLALPCPALPCPALSRLVLPCLTA
jgi:hypothetical protein